MWVQRMVSGPGIATVKRVETATEFRGAASTMWKIQTALEKGGEFIPADDSLGPGVRLMHVRGRSSVERPRIKRKRGDSCARPLRHSNPSCAVRARERSRRICKDCSVHSAGSLSQAG